MQPQKSDSKRKDNFCERMAMKKLLFFVLFLSTLSWCQIPEAVPHPYVVLGPYLGYSGAGYIVNGGIDENSKYLKGFFEVYYDKAPKGNDGTIGNTKGRDRGFKAALMFPAYHRLYLGVGASQNTTNTTNYEKQSWHPAVAGLYDVLGESFSMRLQVNYYLPLGSEHVNQEGCSVPNGQCVNNMQGPLVFLWIPSPERSRHLFARFGIGGYWGHTTITSTDPVLTAQQKSGIVVTSEASFCVGWRF